MDYQPSDYCVNGLLA